MPANMAAPGVSLNELLENRAVRECLQWLTRERPWMNEVHLAVCRVPAPTFLEGERALWFQEQLRGLGWDATLDKAGNVIAVDGSGPYIALTAHLDTVIAARGRDDISVDADGRFRGPGVADNGAGLAALLALARVWKCVAKLPEFRLRLLLAANVGEEGEGNLLGMRYLARQSPLAKKIETYIVVDGANIDHVTSRGLGSRRFELTFTGSGGHSWSDYGVGNPLHALCRAVAWFTEPRLEGAPKSAVNVGLIEGGAGVNAIPQMARAKVDIRSESNEKMDILVKDLEAAMERARDFENQRSTGAKVSAKMKEIGSRPAAALSDDAPILQYLRAVDAHLGIRSHLDCSSTDANIPLSLGVPAIAVGGGGIGGGAHTTQEWFRPEGRDLGLKRIFLLLLLLMRGAESVAGSGR
jgi:acetylornithine deacetylase/succinyl-diaminopimelate desuccinylase-like protein